MSLAQKPEGGFDSTATVAVATRAASAERNILGGFLVALVILAIVSAAAYWSISRLVATADQVEHSHEVIDRLQEVVRSLKTIESARRGYVISGDADFLVSYRRRINLIEPDLRQLGYLIGANPGQLARWNEMRPLVGEIMRFSTQIVDLVQRGDRDGAAAIIKTKRGEQLSEHISALVRAMETEERQILAAHRQQRDTTVRRTFVVIGASGISSVLLLSLALLVIYRDLGRRRVAAAEVTRLSALQRAILDSANFTIISTDTQGIIRTFNTAAQAKLGYAAADVVGKVTPAIIHDAAEVAARAAALSAELGTTVAPGFAAFVAKTGVDAADENEWTYIRKDGSRFPVLLSVTALRDEAGEITGYLGVGQDISERRRAVQALRDSESRLRAVLDSTVDGIIAIDTAGKIESFNRAAERIFGYTAAEISGQNVTLLMPESFRHAHEHQLQNYLATGESHVIGKMLEFEGLRKNGSTVPILLGVSEVQLGAERIFTAVVRDMTDSKKIARMKNEFISTVSHELRTPLTSIRGALGLIAGGAMGAVSGEIKSLIDIATNNSERLVRLINDILDIEKIESGKMVFDIAPVPLLAVIRQTLDAVEAYATQLGVHIELAEADDVMVAADSDRLQQVLTNLLSNAAKFSPRDAAVTVRAQRHAGVVRVSVEDHGPGIPRAFHQRLFEKFAQADASDQRQKGGTGLGLSISKTIVEKHGGIIGYSPVAAGGSIFYFELPVLAHVLPAAAPPAAQNGPHGDVCRILICEDDHDVARLIGLMLEQQGYTCDIAASAEQAKRMITAHRYTAMTLDIMLPGQDGIALVRELRATELHRHLPIIIVSGKAGRGKAELNGGAIDIVDWLDKPIDQERLLKATRRARHSGTNKPRVLHVEDDVDVLKVVATLLADAAMVIPAPTLGAARRLLAGEQFDLVLLDIGLPDGSGVELLPVIEALSPPPPVAVFSAREIDADIVAHVASVLTKTQTSNERLLATISRLIDKSISRDEHIGEKS